MSRADETDSLLFQQPKGPGSGLPSDRKGKSRALPDANGNGESQDFLALDIDGDRGESGTGGDGYQQMQLVEQQVCPSFHSSLPLPLLTLTSHFDHITPSGTPEMASPVGGWILSLSPGLGQPVG